MKTRLLTSLAIVISIILMFVLKIYVSPYFFDFFFLAITICASYEFAKMLSRIGLYNNLTIILTFPAFVTTATLLGFYLNLDFGYTLLISIGLVLVGAIISFLLDLCRKKTINNEIKIRELKNMSNVKFAFKRSLNTMLGLVYPTILFSIMIYINHLDSIGLEAVANFDGKLSLVALIIAFIIPMLTDSFAMLTGMLIGGKKLAPKISPNKTIAGAIGGTLWCTVLSACIYLILQAIDYFAPIISLLEIWKILLIVFFGSIIAQAGDILESFFKRKAGVKDSGKILPGHGGMLDRIDSYIFVAPYLLIAFVLILL